MVMTMTTWLPVTDYPGYEVLADGTVRSVGRLDSIGRAVRARLLRINTKAGYSQARLYRDGVARALLVHRLVLEAFVGPKGYKPEWIDGNRQNSRPSCPGSGSPTKARSMSECTRPGLTLPSRLR